jgi:membrane associated rhomboid family serine protease
MNVRRVPGNKKPVEKFHLHHYVLPVMLENRDYMRAPSFESRRPVTITLLIVNAVAFVLQNVLAYYVPSIPISKYLALSLVGLGEGYVWQLITFQFLHGGLVHLLLNCWGLYVFGRAVEEALGPRSFLLLYFSGGVLGGLCQMVGAMIWSSHLGGAVVGASAGLFGLIAAYAMLYPDRQLTLLLFFVLPISMRAKYLLLFSALMAVFGIVFPDGQVAHAAHLGGMLMGIAYVRQIIHWQWNWLQFRRPSRRPPPRELVNVMAAKWPRHRKTDLDASEEISTEEFLSREVDPILDKISIHGIQSLTERERKILEAARKKMAQR